MEKSSLGSTFGIESLDKQMQRVERSQARAGWKEELVVSKVSH